MKSDINSLSDDTAVEAISLVGKSWLDNRGVEAFVAYNSVREKAGRAFEKLPTWASGPPTTNDESGSFARAMLVTLLEGDDDEVRHWAEEAIQTVGKAVGQSVDPLTLTIGGIILIGAILAARVRRIASVTFYKGIPKELAEVMKVGETAVK